MRNRVETGIAGMDSMLNGGIPEGNQIIIVGGPGSGKTLLCFEYLYRGAKQGQPGIFFSFEEESQRLVQNAKDAFTEFKDIDQLISEKKLVICGSEETKRFVQRDNEQVVYTFGKIISELQNRVEQVGARRIVMDSISSIRLFIKDDFDYRQLSISLLGVFNMEKVTSFVTMEMEGQSKTDARFPQEFFIYDGLVLLYFGGKDTENRMPMMEIMKMRGTHHSYLAIPYEITANGMSILAMS